MLVIGRGAPSLSHGERNDALDRFLLDTDRPRTTAKRYASISKELLNRLPGFRSDHRAFLDVRWMEISSVLQRERDAGRRPEQIKQIVFNVEPLDLASVLHWRRKILANQAPSS